MLFRSYDSVHGRFPLDLSIHKNYLKVNNVDIEITAERDPANLPWSEVDVALECTGIFTDKEKIISKYYIEGDVHFNSLGNEKIFKNFVRIFRN